MILACKAYLTENGKLSIWNESKSTMISKIKARITQDKVKIRISNRDIFYYSKNAFIEIIRVSLFIPLFKLLKQKVYTKSLSCRIASSCAIRITTVTTRCARESKSLWMRSRLRYPKCTFSASLTLLKQE